MAKKIIKCIDCGEMKPHEARERCERCYGRWKFHNVVDKKKAMKRQEKWRKENPELYRKQMREYMRKRLNVKNPYKFTAQELIDVVK